MFFLHASTFNEHRRFEKALCTHMCIYIMRVYLRMCALVCVCVCFYISLTENRDFYNQA